MRATPPYEALDETLRRVAALFEARLVWGPDWPHTAFAPQAMPAYPGQCEPLLRVLSAAQKSDAFERAPCTLYA